MSAAEGDLAARVEAAEQELINCDPVLGVLVARQAPVMRELRTGDYFASLARSIVGQQVSVAAAAAIYGRLEAATSLEPERVLALSDDEWRAAGLSRQKTAYLRDLAERFAANPAVYEHLERLEDEAVVAELIAVKGIGEWTAQMFLMFTLGRLDVFAPDDGGLQRAMKQLCGWDAVPPRAELVRTAEAWRPYRTVASWHLWESLHNTPV